MGASLAASRFSQQLNKKSYQERVDIWDLYCMTFYFRNCDGQNVKMKPPDPPPFDKQYRQVHKCVAEQVMKHCGTLYSDIVMITIIIINHVINVEDLCRNLHNRLSGTNDKQNHVESPFNLNVKKSSIDHQDSGQGVFVTGSAVPGTVITFHPGLVVRIYVLKPNKNIGERSIDIGVICKHGGSLTPTQVYRDFNSPYLPQHIRKMPDYPGMDQKSTYLISRYDGCIIDPSGFNSELKGPDGNVMPHPFAVGHMMNHPPSGKKPNVMPFSYDFHAFPKELSYLIPNRYYKEPGLLFKTQAIMRSLVYVTVNHVCNEELFVNYRLNPNSKLPEWYTPVDKQEDSRRWSST
ncbi:hypothetical protein QZH41_015677 [Actinostola sp. cb2023]|nr:hypothetical protein QZH41_015677 [Actinostola sp. cb2023]